MYPEGVHFACLGVVTEQNKWFTTSPSMFLNRITCLDEPSGEKKKNTSQNMDLHALQSHVHYAKSSADKQTRTVQVRHLSLKQN